MSKNTQTLFRLIYNQLLLTPPKQADCYIYYQAVQSNIAHNSAYLIPPKITIRNPETQYLLALSLTIRQIFLNQAFALSSKEFVTSIIWQQLQSNVENNSNHLLPDRSFTEIHKCNIGWIFPQLYHISTWTGLIKQIVTFRIWQYLQSNV